MDGLKAKGWVVATCGDCIQGATVTMCTKASAISAFSTFVTVANPVPKVSPILLEGRACVASTLAMFQFCVMYGMLFSVAKITGFYYKVFMSNAAYIYVDILVAHPPSRP